MADRKISDLTALTTPATGDLIPIVDVSEAAAADKNKSITVGELLRGAPDGTAAAPGIAFESDGGNGMFLGGTDILAFSTGGTQAVTIDASRRLLVNTSTAPIGTQVGTAFLVVNGRTSGNTGGFMGLLRGATPTAANQTLGAVFFGGDGDEEYAAVRAYSDDTPSATSTPGKLSFQTTATDATTPTEQMRIDSNGVVKFQNGTATDPTISFLNDPDNGIYRATTNTLGFVTAGSEAARIDSSGRLLVGTSSSSVANAAIFQGNSTGSDVGVVTIASETASPANGALLGVLDFSDSGHTRAARVECARDGGTWTSGSSQPSRLVFSTTADGASSPTERMRISSAGTVTLAGDDPSAAVSSAKFFQIAGGSSPSDARFESKSTSTSTRYHFVFTYSTSTIGSITTSGSATAYNTSSDYRLKENVVDISDGITRVKQLKPKRFNFIVDADTTVDGFLAHEAQAVVPECVTGTKDEVDENGDPVYQGIDQSKLVPLLTAALQEAIGEIESLKARIAALESA